MTEGIFLFAGQGSQFKGMAEDICKRFPVARSVIDEMSAVAGENIASFLWETEPSELARSDRSQLAITAMEAAVLAVLQEHGIAPAAVAGFSLGEFAALFAAKDGACNDPRQNHAKMVREAPRAGNGLKRCARDGCGAQT